MTNTIIPVILSGGSGTRLWPMSTPDAPKQFLALTGPHSMFRLTLDRAADRTCFAAPMVVCGPGHVAHVEADLAAAGISDARIIIEPAARNTAPAIALAAHHAGPGAQLLVMPSDHVMTDVPAFLRAVAAAAMAVEQGALATFGITPSGPETGYGYIAAGAERADAPGVRGVDRFVEKPALEAAREMLTAGNYLWNAGIFLMRADRYLAELSAHAPAIAAACEGAMASPQRDGARLRPASAAFLASPSQSIDYAVMERAKDVVVVPVDPGWSDVGGWSALYDLGAKDADDNVASGDVTTVDASGNLIRAGAGKRVAMLGVSDLIVIAHGDDILIIPRTRAQEVKAIV
ncbi:MAG: mannose-1-phosphate guanylyltransferase/mannose-6-phosphate isomerase, partial [Sphingopyxis sp.]